MNKQQEKVWIVTGASGGLGLAIVKTLLAHDIRVAAFSRNAQAVEQAVGHGETGRFMALSVKLHEESSVAAAAERVLQKFGTVDVVVNNAGRGQRGAVEEVTDAEVRSAFDDNFFSQLNMMRCFLPVMRKQKWGYFINLGSVGSFKSKACSGIYCATKYAVNALTQAINLECAAYHIHSTCVKPFDLRTNYLAPTHIQQRANRKECYDSIHRLNQLDDDETHGAQPGDPIKVAELFIKLAEEPEPPCSLFLDYPVEEVVRHILEERREELDRWEHLSQAADGCAVSL